MAVSRGSFGVIGPRFEITDDSILLARRWTPLLLAIGIPVGAWLAVHGLTGQAHGEGGIGVLLILLGVTGVMASPIRPPAQILVSPGLICVGAHRYTPGDVGTIDAQVKRQSGRYGGVMYREWSVAITMLDMHVVEMKLQRGGSSVPPKVDELVVAIATMFAATPRGRRT